MNKGKYHLQAIGESLELALLGAVISISVDLVWCIKDVLHNGISLVYVFILSGLVIGDVLSIIAFKKHHKHNVHTIMHSIMSIKLQNVKCNRRKKARCTKEVR